MSIHGWIGGRYGSPTEYGLPLDDSYLFEDEEEEEDPELISLAATPEGEDLEPLEDGF